MNNKTSLWSNKELSSSALSGMVIVTLSAVRHQEKMSKAARKNKDLECEGRKVLISLSLNPDALSDRWVFPPTGLEVQERRQESRLSPLPVKSLPVCLKMQQIWTKNLLTPVRDNPTSGCVFRLLDTWWTMVAAETVMQGHIKPAAVLKKHIWDV